jgi:hypothetical protein
MLHANLSARPLSIGSVEISCSPLDQYYNYFNGGITVRDPNATYRWWNQTKMFSFMKVYPVRDGLGNYVLDSKGMQSFQYWAEGFVQTQEPRFASSWLCKNTIY